MIEIRQGDWVEVLRTMPDESVQCCVTSPPYWGLRDYGTARWEGGSPDCDHAQYLGGNGAASAKQVTSGGTQKYQYRGTCAKCGAERKDGQLGLERTPDEYVAKMVEGFREVRRVLRKDGTLWLNLGDSYASQGGPVKDEFKKLLGCSQAMLDASEYQKSRSVKDRYPGLKPKDLCGIPWMVAFALRADGWYLRQDIVWAKPNPMPESVRDRCTKSHEYLFLLSKSERYYFDADAIKEPLADSSIQRLSQDVANQIGSDRVPGKTNGNMKAVRFGGAKHGDDESEFSRTKSGEAWEPKDSLRNRRSVWTVTTQPFREAHFATFPPKLVEPCILAGCPEGGTVLDPFAGAGTTGKVCKELDRNAVLIELNPAYIEMIERRIAATKESCREKQATLSLISKEIK